MRPSSLSPLFLSALLAACAGDRIPTASTPQEPIGGRPIAALQCTVSVTDEEMRCRDAAPSLAGSPIILGGQGVYVRLINTGTHYDRVTGIFGTDVTVQNLTAQPLGTPDGIDNWSVRVFFSTGPTATAGSGTVEVANADGVGTITAADQPYFLYPEILRPQKVSRPHRWEFRVSPGVEAFTFGVWVRADIPDAGAILRWVESLPMPGAIGTRRSTSADGVVFVAWMRWEKRTDLLRSEDGGATWTAAPLQVDTAGNPCESTISDVAFEISALWAADASTVYALENRWFHCSNPPVVRGVTRLLRSADGGRTWTRVLDRRTDGVEPGAIWGSAPDDIYVVGYDHTAGSNVLLHTRDGFQSYSKRHLARGIGRLWGVGPDSLFMAVHSSWGDTTVISRSVDGGVSWSDWTLIGLAVAGIWGTATDVWAVGQTAWPHRSVVLHSTDGGVTWSDPEILPGFGLLHLRGTAADNVYAAGDAILRFDGQRWREMDPWWKTLLGWPYYANVMEVLDRDHVVIGGGQMLIQGVR
ncbi:MAG TPA: hypothetical protein VF142_03215 [Longimicrobium sp.]